MLERLKKKWEVSTWQAIVILVVFACTGFTVMFLKEPVLSL
ncbi:MAG: prolipoprotein diacylglyceryl transferase, partial [Fulvivirga sp.]